MFDRFRRTTVASLPPLILAALLSAPADAAAQRADSTESYEDITAEAVTASAVSLPVEGDMVGPSVVAVQALLDQAQFSPGVLDGYWGKNTEKAVYWFQKAHGLDATGTVDQRTLDRLIAEAAQGDVIVRHTLTASEVEGPFVNLPEDVYERAEMECLCYESLAEKLGEVFHATPDLLRKLNPGVSLNALSAGDRIAVPNVGNEPTDPGSTPVQRIVISDGGHWLHAMDGQGNILYHFPSTLGSEFAPSPEGEFSVTSITFDPTWHYKPDLLTGVDPSREDAILPSGPNNAVGVVWMQLSKPHYGIHGTSAPSTIGYVTSHGCVRLTNWDARFLANRIDEGVPVEFVKTSRVADAGGTGR